MQTSSDWETVKSKQALYWSLQEEKKDRYGWLPPLCDGLLFNALAAYAGHSIDPMQAEEAPGRWRRHPNFSLCHPGIIWPEIGGSRSTVSRDMFRGLFIWLLSRQDKAAMERIRDYGKAHRWIMGEGLIGATLMSPGMVNQLYRMIDRTVPRIEEEAEDAYPTDYEAHLRVISVYTEYMIYGHITDWDLKTLDHYAQNYPRNALFQALYHKFTDGDQTRAMAILLDESLFPQRLPTDADRYTHYLWQRDPGPDWEPCIATEDPDVKYRCLGETHVTTDYDIVVAVIEK